MYRRLGFQEIPTAELGDRLRKTMRHNAEGPLAQWPRVAMRRTAPADDTTTDEENPG
jgi:hypothetical protein